MLKDAAGKCFEVNVNILQALEFNFDPSNWKIFNFEVEIFKVNLS